MTNNNHLTEIRDFVVNNFLFGNAGDVKDDTSFLEHNVLDSTGILELVTFLESRYQIKVQDREMLPENLDSIERVSSFVAGKLAARTSTQA
jgi:acyl carrier protein